MSADDDSLDDIAASRDIFRFQQKCFNREENGIKKCVFPCAESNRSRLFVACPREKTVRCVSRNWASFAGAGKVCIFSPEGVSGKKRKMSSSPYMNNINNSSGTSASGGGHHHNNNHNNSQEYGADLLLDGGAPGESNNHHAQNDPFLEDGPMMMGGAAAGALDDDNVDDSEEGKKSWLAAGLFLCGRVVENVCLCFFLFRFRHGRGQRNGDGFQQQPPERGRTDRDQGAVSIMRDIPIGRSMDAWGKSIRT